MSVLAKLTDFIGGSIFKEVKDIVTTYLPPDVSPTKRAELALALQELEYRKLHEAEQIVHEQNLAQMEINKIEATNTNIFVSGWRPFIGWVCGVALAYGFILEPMLRFLCKVLFGYDGSFPEIQLGALDSILMGMIGLGSLRTLERVKGVANEKLK